MTNALASLSINRGALRLRLDIDLRLLAASALLVAVVAADVSVILLGAPKFDVMTEVYTVT